MSALLHGRVVYNAFALEKDIARYLQAKGPAVRVMSDDQQSDHIILFGNGFGRFVTTRSPDHRLVVENPVGQVDYVLVPDDASAVDNFIVKRYPDIYLRGADFLELEHEWKTPTSGRGWRLYRVQPARESGQAGR